MASAQRSNGSSSSADSPSSPSSAGSALASRIRAPEARTRRDPASNRRRELAPSRPATHTAFSVSASVLVVVLLALLVQVFAPHFSHTVLNLITRDRAPGLTLRNPLILHSPPICPVPQAPLDSARGFTGSPHTLNTFNTAPERSMALAEQAKRVAAEFDYSPDAVNKAVHEFIREMGTLLLCHPQLYTRLCHTDSPQTRASRRTAPS
jgi:hexokinase